MSGITNTDAMPSTDGLPARAPRRPEILGAGLASIAVSMLYLASAAAHGALGASRNDDWAYYRVAYNLADHGRFVLNGWPSMTLIGQALLSQPVIGIFGSRIAPLQIMVVSLGAAGLWASYLVVRGFLSSWWATIAVGCVALGPIFGTLAVSFMTDVPAFSFTMVAMLTATKAVRNRRPSLMWFAVSMLLAFCAFSIREYGLVAGLAAATVALRTSWKSDRRRAGLLLAITVLWATCICALYLWRANVPDSSAFQTVLSSDHIREGARTLFNAAVTLSLLVTPVVLAVSPIRVLRSCSSRVRAASGLAAVLVVSLAVIWRPRLSGNYFTATGSYAITLAGAAPDVLPSTLMTCLRVVGVASLASLVLILSSYALTVAGRVGAAGPVERSTDGPRHDLTGFELVGSFIIWSVAILSAVVLFTTGPFFDRYLIALVPFLAALTISIGSRLGALRSHPRVVSAAALVAIALLGIAVVDASSTFDGAKWRLAESVRAAGYPAPTIDGGFEWFGYHQTGIAEPETKALDGRPFWTSMFGSPQVCVTSQFGPGGPTVKSSTAIPPAPVSTVSETSIFGTRYHLDAYRGPDACDGRADPP